MIKWMKKEDSMLNIDDDEKRVNEDADQYKRH